MKSQQQQTTPVRSSQSSQKQQSSQQPHSTNVGVKGPFGSPMQTPSLPHRTPSPLTNPQQVSHSVSNTSLKDTEVMSSDSSEEDDDDEEEEEDFFDSDEEMTWIQRFLSRRGNEYFCEVDEEWIKDAFNLYGIAAQVRGYNDAMRIILTEELTDPTPAELRSAEVLYGLIHARFIVTSYGLQLMNEKYRQGHFGYCPRVLCQSHPLLPVGQSDLPCQHSVKLYCPQCEEIYYPRSQVHQEVDGAYFGTSFPHMLLMQYPETKKPSQRYVPKIFGFKLRKSAPTGPKLTTASSASVTPKK